MRQAPPPRRRGRSYAGPGRLPYGPNVDPDAKRFTNLTYREALAAGVKVMDASAFVLANEQKLLMHVFDVAAVGAMKAICQGEDIGTRITSDDHEARA